MDSEPEKSLRDKVGTFVKDYGQTLFTLGTLIFASGSLYADVQSIKSKTDKIEITEIQQVRLTDQIKQLTNSQEKQSEAVSKLTDAVNTLSQSLALVEQRQEYQERKRR